MNACVCVCEDSTTDVLHGLHLCIYKHKRAVKSQLVSVGFVQRILACRVMMMIMGNILLVACDWSRASIQRASATVPSNPFSHTDDRGLWLKKSSP